MLYRHLSFFSLILLATLAVSAEAAKSNRQTMQAPVMDPVEQSPWNAAFNYGVSTDFAEQAQPRAYYQGLTAMLSRQFSPQWTGNLGVAATFTTLDGQIDKKQENTVAEASGLNPSVGLGYANAAMSPWFFGVSGTALMDSASRLEGYVGLLSGNVGGTWKFWDDRISMTHTLVLTELLNTFEYSSAGTPNQGTSVAYGWANSLGLGEHFTLSGGFGLKQTRYLDGFWDYAYNTWISAAVIRGGWTASLTSSNGGYTDDGRVSLWYIDQYRRIVSLSLAYSF